MLYIFSIKKFSNLRKDGFESRFVIILLPPVTGSPSNSRILREMKTRSCILQIFGEMKTSQLQNREFIVLYFFLFYNANLQLFT